MLHSHKGTNGHAIICAESMGRNTKTHQIMGFKQHATVTTMCITECNFSLKHLTVTMLGLIRSLEKCCVTGQYPTVQFSILNCYSQLPENGGRKCKWRLYSSCGMVWRILTVLMSSIISRMESVHVFGRPEIWHTLSVLWGQQLENILIRAPVFCEQAIHTTNYDLIQFK